LHKNAGPGEVGKFAVDGREGGGEFEAAIIDPELVEGVWRSYTLRFRKTLLEIDGNSPRVRGRYVKR
jgi:hypothetical protein